MERCLVTLVTDNAPLDSYKSYRSTYGTAGHSINRNETKAKFLSLAHSAKNLSNFGSSNFTQSHLPFACGCTVQGCV